MAVFRGEPSAVSTILVVRDVEEAARWYTEVLGAEPYRAYGGTTAVVSFLGAWFVLVTGAGPTEDKPSVTFGVPMNPDEVDHSFTIRVADCRAAYEDLRARGAVFLTPPHDRGSEVRCFFGDPDGHLFEISEARG